MSTTYEGIHMAQSRYIKCQSVVAFYPLFDYNYNMQIGSLIDITMLNNSTPLYRMEIAEITEYGFHGRYKCDVRGNGWDKEDWIKESDKVTDATGLIFFHEISKIELVK